MVGALCGALESLTRAPALEEAPLRVTAVASGVVRTELRRDLPEAERGARFRAAAASLEPADAAAEASLYLMLGGTAPVP